MGLELLLIFPPGLGDAAAAVYTTVADVGHRTRNGEPKKSGIFYPAFLKTALQAVNIVFQIKKIALNTSVPATQIKLYEYFTSKCKKRRRI